MTLNLLPNASSCTKGKIWGERCRVCDFLWLVGGEITGWYSRNLVLSLKLPSSTWVGALVPTEELKGIGYVYSLWWNQDPALLLHYYFLTASPLFLHSLSSLISNCLNMPFGTQGRSRRLKPFSYKQDRGHRQAFVPRKAPQGPVQFQIQRILYWYDFHLCIQI